MGVGECSSCFILLCVCCSWLWQQAHLHEPLCGPRHIRGSCRCTQVPAWRARGRGELGACSGHGPRAHAGASKGPPGQRRGQGLTVFPRLLVPRRRKSGLTGAGGGLPSGSLLEQGTLGAPPAAGSGARAGSGSLQGGHDFWDPFWRLKRAMNTAFGSRPGGSAELGWRLRRAGLLGHGSGGAAWLTWPMPWPVPGDSEQVGAGRGCPLCRWLDPFTLRSSARTGAGRGPAERERHLAPARLRGLLPPSPACWGRFFPLLSDRADARWRRPCGHSLGPVPATQAMRAP